MVKSEMKSELNESKQNGGGKSQMEAEQFRKLFIGGLSLNTTDESLHSFYSQYGELLDCIVMRDAATKRSRGFGFVSFSCKEEVDRAMEARPHTIDGKVVDPKRAVPREQSQKSEQNMSTKRLYVSGVRDEHTEEMFRNHFSEFGSVVKVEIIQDKNTNKARGFAFINFDDYDPVDKCVLLKSHMIQGYRCDVKKALSKDDMQKAAQKERDRHERGMRSRGPGQRGGGGGGGGGGYGGGRHSGGGGGGGYGGPPAGGYGGQYGGYGAPPPHGPGGYGGYGPPAAAPQWGAYGAYPSGSYGSPAPTGWGAPAGPTPGAAPAGPQATEQGQWGATAAGTGYGAAAGAAQAGWGTGAQWSTAGGGAVAGAGQATMENAAGTAWPPPPQGVPPPPPQQWSAGRY